MLNIKHTLYPYQERDMNKVVQLLEQGTRKICFVAQTSYGKTISFSTIAKWYKHNYKKKVLILCHREELVSQSMETIVRMGMTVEKILPSTKRMHNMADVYIAMEMTLFNRLKKNKHFLLDVGLVIIDEAHSQLFNKHIDFFNEQKILGFTATPVLTERVTYWKCGRCESVSYTLDNCCGMEMWEWSKPKTLSMYYDDIVVGASTTELIEFGSIVKDFNICASHDLSSLKTDSTGEYTTESQNKLFGSDELTFDVVKHYEQYALGKKTIIFNPSAKVNKIVYDKFKEKGYNCRIYDSVNDKDGSRKELVKWFEENDDAILINVNVFTTGFDNREVQCIILNRAIGSLSLFLQCAGRGARSSKKIYKDHFILIDLGGNVNRHGKWSDDTRDWERIFREGIGADKPKKEQPLSVSECKNCGMLYSRNTNVCPECGESKPIRIKKRVESEEILQPIDNIPLPNGAKISHYVKSKEGDIFMAFAIMTQQIVDLFMYHGISRERYEKWKRNGKLDKRIGEIVRPCYFVFLSEFKGDGKRTLKQVLKKVGEKIDKYYNI